MAPNQPPIDDPFYRRGGRGGAGRRDGGERDPFARGFSRDAFSRDSLNDDALLLDAGLTEDDGEEPEQQFRRVSRRVPVRRGPLGAKNAGRVKVALVVLLVLTAVGAAGYECYRYAVESPRFRVSSERDIEFLGEAPNSKAQVMNSMKGTVGHSIFSLSLDGKRKELERLPWVESATLVRIWPHGLKVQVKERVPVAFMALSDRVVLSDAEGVLMELPPNQNYSFPVIVGQSENEPASTRAARMKQYTRLIAELDGDGVAAKAHYSRDLEEVDLSDPEDVKVLAKGGMEPILLHLGNEQFLQRFLVFLSNVQKWEQEQGRLKSVDLRFGRGAVVTPMLAGGGAAAAKPAEAASASTGDKPAGSSGASKPEIKKPDVKKLDAKKPDGKKTHKKSK
jgi:cell division protein FtsQ